jgi:hypothetical protein
MGVEMCGSGVNFERGRDVGGKVNAWYYRLLAPALFVFLLAGVVIPYSK